MEEREKGTIRAGKVSAVTVTSGQLFLLLVVVVALKSFQQLSSSFSVSQVSQFGKLSFFFSPPSRSVYVASSRSALMTSLALLSAQSIND